MIKNIIFDMGKVLIKFDTDIFIDRIGIKDISDRKILTNEIFKSAEWSMMDRGILTEEEACLILEKRVPKHLKDKVNLLVRHWYDEIIPIDGMKELVKELKNNGYDLYLLSNASLNLRDYWPKVPGNEYFDGVVVSSDIKYVKPQFEIYRYILDKYNLKAEESVFIDDVTLNVEAAIYLGLKGIVFHEDASELIEKLKALGITINM